MANGGTLVELAGASATDEAYTLRRTCPKTDVRGKSPTDFAGQCTGLGVGLVFETRLTGPGWQRGVLFALIPWLFSLVVFLPLVGGGLLGLSLGAGPLPMLGNLILHVVYGAALGAIYGAVDSMEERSVTPDSEDVLSASRSMIGAARGILVGLVVGIGVGLLTALVPQLTGSHALGMNPLALGLAMALIGASFGALVGSLQAS
jgi:hypothetical protein